MTRRLLYATTNPGKMAEVRTLMALRGVDVLAPPDLGLDFDVPEAGSSLEDNAAEKARAYLAAIDARTVVLADDTGVEIDALGGEPGIHVRRWTGEGRMGDEAIIEYALARLAGVPPAERGAQFRTVFAIGVPGRPIAYYDGTLRGIILEQADPLRISGFPFESIFYVPEWAMLLGDVHRLPAAVKAGYITHRERALRNALPHLVALLDGA